MLSAEVARSSLPVRSGAPITIIWSLKSQSTALLEGRLELTVHDGNEVLARFVSDELVLGTGEQLVRTMLPPLDTSSVYNSAEMRLKFVGTRLSIDLKEHPLRLPAVGQRGFVVAVCDPWQTTLSQDKQLFLKQLRFETYNSDTADMTISTNLAHVRPGDMPGDPLGYCGFDLVVLISEGFSDLKEAQLEALLAWVDAGGSLCIVPGRQGLGKPHLQFLDRLAEGTGAAPFLLDSKGLLINSDQLLLRHWGLGRVAILRSGLTQLDDPSHADRRRLLAFVWKLRQDQFATFLGTGQWSVQTPTVPGVVVAPNQPVQIAAADYSQIRHEKMKLAPVALQTGDQLLSRLMPRDLRVVPLGLVGLLLLLYVLVIGPVDYFFLGAIRRRRLTWVLFPAVTIAFAVLTVLFSNWYMGSADNRRSVTFLDIGESGTIARRNQFQVLFRGTQGQVVTDVRQGLLTAMNHQQFSRGTWYNYQMAMNRGTQNQLDLVREPVYRGRVPAQYTLEQQLPQWTPQLNRLMQLAPADEATPFDWQSRASLKLWEGNVLTAADVTKVEQAVRAAFGPEASIYTARGTQVRCLGGRGDFLQKDEQQIYGANYYGNVYNPGMNQNVSTTFLQDVCSPWISGGLFSVVSQISPTGGRDFEDLALIDPSDSRQWLLIVIVERGDELVVYRKLYTGEP